MKATILAGLFGLLGGGVLGLACGGGRSCQNLVHQACDLDGGCASGLVCVPAGDAIDLCAQGTAACCFSTCTRDSDCPSGESCASTIQGKVCAQGRCAVPH